jgi:hypothetical protein
MNAMRVGSLAALCALAALPALAHHGWSEYDATKPLKLTGKVLKSGYEHPHGHVQLEANGKKWMVILAPPSRMENRGLAAAEIAAGKSVAVEGYPNRAKAEEMRAERITAGGKTIELR